ncbi:MAG: SRPBCC family protein [Acidimicrobiia bacterium]
MTAPLHQLAPVGLDFLESAPVRFDYAAELPAPADRVFAVISADPVTWTWFPGLTEGRYEDGPPYGVGTRRAVVMEGVTYRETVLAWDEPTRWAYRVDESSESTFRALAEDWVMEPQGDQSVLRWTFAVDPVPDLTALIAGAREMIGSVFLDAMDSLAAYLMVGDR